MLEENYNITKEVGKQVGNIIDWKQPSYVFDDPVTCYMEDFFSSKLKPLSNHEIEDVVGGLKHEDRCELIQGSSVPFNFSSFEFLKKKFKTIIEEKDGEPMKDHIISLETIYNKLYKSSQIFNDPIDIYLDGFYSQICPPLANYDPEYRGDEDLVRQPTSMFCPVGVPLKNSNESLQPYHDSYKMKLHEIKDAYKGLYSF